MKVMIFAGATLTEAEVRRALPGAAVGTLVERGDLHRAIDAGVQVVGIVDGTFLSNVAMSPIEIVDALRVGVRVFGAGGVGALRAVELAHFGMTGCGRIFERIAQTRYFRDDDLGPVRAGQTPTDRPLALIEFELSCEASVAQGRLTEAHARRLVRSLREVHFSRRSFEALAAKTRDDALREAVATVRKHHVDHKRLDAKAMLALISAERRRTRRANDEINAG